MLKVKNGTLIFFKNLVYICTVCQAGSILLRGKKVNNKNFLNY